MSWLDYEPSQARAVQYWASSRVDPSEPWLVPPLDLSRVDCRLKVLWKKITCFCCCAIWIMLMLFFFRYNLFWLLGFTVSDRVTFSRVFFVKSNRFIPFWTYAWHTLLASVNISWVTFWYFFFVKWKIGTSLFGFGLFGVTFQQIYFSWTINWHSAPSFGHLRNFITIFSWNQPKMFPNWFLMLTTII